MASKRPAKRRKPAKKAPSRASGRGKAAKPGPKRAAGKAAKPPRKRRVISPDGEDLEFEQWLHEVFDSE